jgi:hypothetical protein
VKDSLLEIQRESSTCGKLGQTKGMPDSADLKVTLNYLILKNLPKESLGETTLLSTRSECLTTLPLSSLYSPLR